MSNFYRSAGFDLSTDPLNFNEGDYVLSYGAGAPANGPGTESAPWVLRQMIFHQPEDSASFAGVYPGWQLFQTKNGSWNRPMTRNGAPTSGVYALSYGPWVKIQNFGTAVVNSVNGKTGAVSLGLSTTVTGSGGLLGVTNINGVHGDTTVSVVLSAVGT